MRKEFIDAHGQRATQPAPWLNLQQIAKVEITSEDDLFPIEHALSQAVTTGWRAATLGPQTIRIVFNDPQELHRIQIHIIDRAAERTQEMVVLAEMAGMGQQEVWRGNFTFSPRGTTEELEDLTVELAHVNALELRIDPDRGRTHAASQEYATLTSLKLS